MEFNKFDTNSEGKIIIDLAQLSEEEKKLVTEFIDFLSSRNLRMNLIPLTKEQIEDKRLWESTNS